jgi:hypothetical protein
VKGLFAKHLAVAKRNLTLFNKRQARSLQSVQNPSMGKRVSKPTGYLWGVLLKNNKAGHWLLKDANKLSHDFEDAKKECERLKRNRITRRAQWPQEMPAAFMNRASIKAILRDEEIEVHEGYFVIHIR